jgi:peptidyl-dipeptidase Dcp
MRPVEEAVCAKALDCNGAALKVIPPRYRSTYFMHIIGGYAAAYYSYIWSELLDADTVDWFVDPGGLKRANGDHFRATLLSRGGSADAMELYQAFRGREPIVEPLLERRGFLAAPER